MLFLQILTALLLSRVVVDGIRWNRIAEVDRGRGVVLVLITTLQVPFPDYMIDFCKNVMKSSFDIGGVKGGRLDEGEPMSLCKRLGFIGGHSSQVSQVTLIANQHDHNVWIGVIPELAQPPLHILVGEVLRNVVH